MFSFKNYGCRVPCFLFLTMGESQSLSAHENADALWDTAQPMQTLHGKKPARNDFTHRRWISFHWHSPSHIVVSWDWKKSLRKESPLVLMIIDIGGLMIARTFPWWKYSGDPSIRCMSGGFLTTNLRLAHGAGSLTGCFPQAVSSAPLFRRHKKFGLGQNGKETDWTLLKLNFMLQTLKKHWLFSECLTCFFFFRIARMSWWRSIKKMGRLVLPLARALWLLFQVKNPPFAASLVVRYSPRLEKDLGTIQRLAPKNEGFGSVG